MRGSRPEGDGGGAIVVERREGLSGELVLRRRGEAWEVVLNGAFLIASVNEASSRALIAVTRPYLPRRALDVLIGGLGMGYALDEVLALRRLRGVTVVEYEPVVVEWFKRYFDARVRTPVGARPSTDPDAPCPPVTIVVADVADVLRDSAATFDLVALDTDNGPAWLVRDENAALYEPRGLEVVRRALRPGGVVVFWSPERYPWFERRLEALFARVMPSQAHDDVQGRRLTYTMYVCLA